MRSIGAATRGNRRRRLDGGSRGGLGDGHCGLQTEEWSPTGKAGAAPTIKPVAPSDLGSRPEDPLTPRCVRRTGGSSRQVPSKTRAGAEGEAARSTHDPHSASDRCRDPSPQGPPTRALRRGVDRRDADQHDRAGHPCVDAGASRGVGQRDGHGGRHDPIVRAQPTLGLGQDRPAFAGRRSRTVRRFVVRRPRSVDVDRRSRGPLGKRRPPRVRWRGPASSRAQASRRSDHSGWPSSRSSTSSCSDRHRSNLGH